MNKVRIGLVGLAALIAMLGTEGLAVAGEKLRADLNGFQEAPSTISTTGSGEFRGGISKDETSIEYELTYSDIQVGPVIAAHIHLGQPGLAGGVIAFLCGGGGKPACPSTAGTVAGTITAADVIGPAAQGIAAGEFAEVLRAIRQGATYVNVHSTEFPGGEIRGKVTTSGGGN